MQGKKTKYPQNVSLSEAPPLPEIQNLFLKFVWNVSQSKRAKVASCQICLSPKERFDIDILYKY